MPVARDHKRLVEGTARKGGMGTYRESIVATRHFTGLFEILRTDPCWPVRKVSHSRRALNWRRYGGWAEILNTPAFGDRDSAIGN